MSLDSNLFLTPHSHLVPLYPSLSSTLLSVIAHTHPTLTLYTLLPSRPGTLRAPLFDATRPLVLNLAAAGALIGRELYRAVDASEGRFWNETGGNNRRGGGGG